MTFIDTDTDTGLWQRTLKGEGVLTGVGVHSGNKASLRLIPAEADQGIVFIRTDLKNGARAIQARWDKVVDTRLCTVLGNEHGGTIGTVEHLMAALSGCGIDNATVEIDGPEIPIMDGSAGSFVELIESIGTTEQDVQRRSILVLKPVEITDGNRTARLLPDSSPRYSLEIDFGDGPIKRQQMDFDLSRIGFKSEIGRARTFGFYEDGEKLRSMGLGLGCSLENTVVIKDKAIMNAEGLRFENEFVRHKLLDAIGDLALAGAPLRAKFQGCCTGHAMNNKLLRALFADPTAWRLVAPERSDERAFG
jgi:UDP-3-O-[3-hydroxymyristoyl] N-acetylglucosamine deacetylase